MSKMTVSPHTYDFEFDGLLCRMVDNGRLRTSLVKRFMKKWLALVGLEPGIHYVCNSHQNTCRHITFTFHTLESLTLAQVVLK